MDETHHLVTAIVTTHNRIPSMVVRAVVSVLGQTYHPMEIIVVDDSDADYPLRDEVERSLRKLSPKIDYIWLEDSRGANAARNVGLCRARGHYVAFLDDDDEWFPNKIERQVKSFDTDDSALVYCRCLVVNELIGMKYVSSSKHFCGDVFNELLFRDFVGGTSGPLLRKRCVKEVGGFDELMESAQDYDLWLRIARRYSVSFVDEPLYAYHIHDGKRISTNAKAKIAGIERIIEKYHTLIRCDGDILYMKLRDIIPYQLQAYGRGEAFKTWLSCMRLRPARVSSNVKSLAMIVLGYESYASIVGKVNAVLFRRDIAILRRRNNDG